MARKTDDTDITHVHDYGIDLTKRELFLFPRDEFLHGAGDDEILQPGVEYGMSNQFIKNLRLLTALSDAPVLIHMKTCGGFWEEGMAIYNAVVSSPAHITILNYASARSMSSIIFTGADRRVMMPYSTFMFHKGTNHFGGTVTQFDTYYKESKKADEIMLDIYYGVLQDCNKMRTWSEKRIKNWVVKEMKEKEDVYLTAEEAVEYNFADEIFGADGKYNWAELKSGA